MSRKIIILWGLVVALTIFGGIQFSSTAQWKQVAHTWRTAAEGYCAATVIWEDIYGIETEQDKCDFAALDTRSEK